MKFPRAPICVVALLLVPALLVPALLAAQGAARPGPPGYVYGTVTDSVSGRALAGASVMLVDATDSSAHPWHADTDSSGRFRIDSVPPGQYMAGFDDPLLDTLRIEAPARRVVVQAARGVEIDLATPSTPTLRHAYCGARGDSGYFGVVVGIVRDAVTRAPLAGGQVVGRTPILAKHDGKLRPNLLEVAAPSGADGAFFLCGLPPGRPIDLVASASGDSSGTFTVDLPPMGLLTRDVFVGASTGGVVSGRVVRQEGAPIRGARILLDGSSEPAISDDSGRFALRGVPLGTRTLSTRAIGYFPEQRVVDVLGGGAVALELTLPTVQSVLDTIHVYGQRVFRDREGFEERRRMGFGTFLERARIEEMHAARAADILRQVPTVTVMPGGLLDTHTGRLCVPDVVVDGNRIPLRSGVDEIDTWIQPQDVQAVEVYTGATAPAEYLQSGRPPCATILIWTNPAFSTPIPK